MRTKATVKNYGMEIIGSDGNRLKGNWTGGVRTKVQNSYLTMPVLAAYKLNPRFTLKSWYLLFLSYRKGFQRSCVRRLSARKQSYRRQNQFQERSYSHL